jgi:glucarate dehydratase
VYRPGTEIGALKLLRQEFGDSLNIRIDPNGVWSPEETIRLARALMAYDLEWLEDPTWGIEAMARVRAAVPIVLATNMCVRNYDEIPVAFRSGAIDVLLGDPRIWGGVWTTRKVAAACEAINLGFGLHSSHECGIAQAARLHLAASTAHLSYAVDVTSWFHAADIITRPFQISGGLMQVPDGPGLGVELDTDAMQSGIALHEREGDVLPGLTKPSRYRWWI